MLMMNPNNERHSLHTIECTILSHAFLISKQPRCQSAAGRLRQTYLSYKSRTYILLCTKVGCVCDTWFKDTYASSTGNTRHPYVSVTLHERVVRYTHDQKGTKCRTLAVRSIRSSRTGTCMEMLEDYILCGAATNSIKSANELTAGCDTR